MNVEITRVQYLISFEQLASRTTGCVLNSAIKIMTLSIRNSQSFVNCQMIHQLLSFSSFWDFFCTHKEFI